MGDSTDAVPTPSTSAPVSDSAASSLTVVNFLDPANGAQRAHFKRGKIFKQTRQMMRHTTKTMQVFASRGHKRAGHVPTKRTRPALHGRRWSADVLIRPWERWKQPWYKDGVAEKLIGGPNYHENEPPIQLGSTVEMPDPYRYVGFQRRWTYQIPPNGDTFFRLGDAMIRNIEFLNIRATVVEDLLAWMSDNSLNMAMEVLLLNEDCQAYSIDIANSNIAQVFYFAAMEEDGSGQEYDEYRARFRNKRWVFIIINDGFGAAEYDGSAGVHWSLVAMNFSSKTYHYYDSFNVDKCAVGHKVGLGLLLILGQDPRRWRFLPEWNSPDQQQNNAFKYDAGPCGPFVYMMTRFLIAQIKHSSASQASRYFLALDPGVPEWFGRHFNSLSVRYDMQGVIMNRRRRTHAENIMHQHDQAAVQGEETIMSPDLPAPFEVPRKRLPYVVDHYISDTPESPAEDLQHDESDTKFSTTSSDDYETTEELYTSDLSMSVDTNSNFEEHREQQEEWAEITEMGSSDRFMGVDTHANIEEFENQQGGFGFYCDADSQNVYDIIRTDGGQEMRGNTPYESDNEDVWMASSARAI